MADLPTGTVTFLLTDVEGSTRLWEQSPAAMREALWRHDDLIEELVLHHRGTLVRPRGEGDSRFAVFADAGDAVAAACAIQLALSVEAWPTETLVRVRMALHTGGSELRAGDYYGTEVNRCARIRGIAHGGQTLLSQATVDLASSSLPPATSLNPLGSFRLRDLQRPERLYQLMHPGLPADFPPLKSLDTLPTNLPVQLSTFIGREREMAEVKRLLADTRLLTLTGAGGCGKTRLALQVSADLLDEYVDGVWLAELAALADESLVPQVIASCLSIREEPGRALTETLAQNLRSRSLLLLLDNCEHLVAACAEIVEFLAQQCPNLRFLATSRESLRLPGETVWRVPSLSLTDRPRLPTLDAGLRSEASQLFLDRARLLKPDVAFTEDDAASVEEICHRLDGIPLGIELAAAWVNTLSPRAILDRLHDRLRLLARGSRTAPPRQQTLQAAMDWSYELLTEQEGVLLARLSVFAGGFSLVAAEEVSAGNGVEESDVLGLVSRLVDKSLVVREEQPGEGRYRLLQTVRQYASGKLARAGEAAPLSERHCRWFLELAERAEPELKGVDEARWQESLDTEHDNLRAALRWSLESDEPASCLRLAVALTRFWRTRGYLSEARSWLDRALAASRAATALRANALNEAGFIARCQGDYPAARRLCQEALAISRQFGDDPTTASALNALGTVLVEQGEEGRGIALYEESLALRRKLGDKWGIASCLNNIGETARCMEDYERAAPLSEESLHVAREIGDKRLIAAALHTLGHVAQGRRQYSQAAALHKESLVLRQEIGDREGIAESLEAIARLAGARGRPELAARLCAAAAALRSAMGFPLPPPERAFHDRTLGAIRSQLNAQALGAAWTGGEAMTVESATAYALEETDRG